ncbi:protein of unknown function [Candidatus Methylomirabilis oxygeniifera]|uniref:Uncharacterized protein n=1 Tax=Methylomirabilis oxygeniifera TaxID=671143 RepID=D5ML10_METO1|nr:protein of unknown function [Candidatus Methylomirabilis oxyfera]
MDAVAPPLGCGYYHEEGMPNIPSSFYFRFDNLRSLPYNSPRPTNTLNLPASSDLTFTEERVA